MSDGIKWIPTKRERRTKDVHAVSYGVECSNCKRFQNEPTRFCADCGRKFDGEIIKKENVRKWQEWKE